MLELIVLRFQGGGAPSRFRRLCCTHGAVCALVLSPRYGSDLLHSALQALNLQPRCGVASLERGVLYVQAAQFGGALCGR